MQIKKGTEIVTIKKAIKHPQKQRLNAFLLSTRIFWDVQ